MGTRLSNAIIDQRLEGRGITRVTDYAGSGTPLIWQCDKGHRWSARPDKVAGKLQRGCPHCAGNSRMTNEIIDRRIAGRGITRLSDYVNNKTPLQWKCVKGHTWAAKPEKVAGTEQTGCPHCAGKIRMTNEDIDRLFAESGKGIVRTTDYISANRKMGFRCSEGHQWATTPASIIHGGTGCPRCAGVVKKTNADIDAMALEDGRGYVRTTDFVDMNTPIGLKCSNGPDHEWMASPSNVFGKYKKGCPHCAGNIRLDIKAMQELARPRGGECLSTRYTNTQTKLKWRCGDGHSWRAVPSSIQRGSWCPYCSQLNSERICRDIIEQLTGHTFPKVKPRWLKNDRGNVMEIDGFCGQLGIGFEYHGVQHFKLIEYFHIRGSDNLTRRQRDDERKQQLCRQHGVTLIEIPYTVNPEDLPTFIHDAIRASGHPVPLADPTTVTVAIHVMPEKLREYQSIAESRGGKLLSTQFINARTPIEFQCGYGHAPWKASPYSVKSGQWCPVCADAKRIETKLARSTANRNSQSGIKGVRQSVYGTWHARIRVGGVLKHLGTFKTAEQAIAAYESARKAQLSILRGSK